MYAPSTIGTLLREFTFGHARQLESVLRELLVALCGQAELLPGADNRLFVDIDSLRSWYALGGALLGMPVHRAVARCRRYTEGVSARAAVSSVDATAQYRTSDQGGQPIRYRPPASLPQVHPGQSDRRSDAQ